MGKKSGLAFLAGAATGALAMLFMPDKKRQKAKHVVESKAKDIKFKLDEISSDERVKKIFGKISAETQKAYEQAQVEIAAQLEKVRSLDEGKYQQIVDSAIDKLKQGKSITAEQLQRLKQEFRDFYEVDESKSKK